MPEPQCDQGDLEALSFEGYRAVDVLGRGKSKGTVYEVWSRVGGERAAAKWPITKREQDLWLQLADAPGRLGLPHLLAEGSIHGEPYVVTEILGKPLSHLFNDIKCCPFSCRWRIVSIVGRLLLRRLQFLHHAGVVHCDINPTNVLMGVPHAAGRDRYKPFFVDLGTAQRYPGNPPLSEYVGTIDFNSIRSAEGGVRRPRDDCEAVGWMLLHGLFGELPWFDRSRTIDWSSRSQRVRAARQCQEAKLQALESSWQDCGRGWAHLRQTPPELDRFLRLSRGVNGADHGALADLLGARENLTQAPGQEEEDLMLLTLAIHDGLQNAHGQKAFPAHSEASAAPPDDEKWVWEVVGGSDLGGITVRRGKLISSEQLPMRLHRGALLLEESREGERLRYRKISGEGPEDGWVSVTVKGKPLLANHGQKSSLLDPAERRRQGLKQREGSAVWWADWEDIFAELYGAEAGQAAAAAAPPPPEAPPLPRELAPSAGRVDVVLFGATGLIGMMACRLMQDQFHDRSFALAGRSQRKLRLIAGAVERRLGSSSVFRGALQVSTQEDLQRLAQSARVVVDFSGPKFQLGQALAEACVRSGTHYVDTTTYEGDMLLARQAREALDAPAKASKVCLVYFCGAYPVQVDVGTWTIVNHIRQHYKRATRRVDVFQTMKMRLSGSAMLSFIGPPGFDIELRRSKLLPFLLGGVRSGGPRDEDEDDLVPVEVAEAPGLWAIDGGRNAEVMIGRCSCGLFDGAEPYGKEFIFKNWDVQPDQRNFEQMLINNAVLKRSHEDLRLSNKIPSPGQGADRRHRQQQWCRRIFVAEVDEPGQQLVLHRCLQPGPSGLGDPSEGTSCVALLAALCLLTAIDAGRELRFGFGTPAWHLSHLGYADWLEANGYWELGPVRQGRPSGEDFLRMAFAGP